MQYGLLVWRILAVVTALLLAFLITFFYGAVGYGSGIGWTYKVVVLGYPGTVIMGLIFWHRSIRSSSAAALFRVSAWIIFLLPLFLLIGWTGWVAGLGDAFVSTLSHLALAALPAILVVSAYLIFYHSIRFAWINVIFLGSIAVLQAVITRRGSATLGDAFSSVSLDGLILTILIVAVAAVIALLNYLAIRKVPSYQEPEPRPSRFVPLWWGLAFLALSVSGLSSFGITARAVQEIGQDASRDWSDTLIAYIESDNLIALREQLNARRSGISIAPKALVMAVKLGRTEAIMSMIEAGADIEGETIIDYETALTSAASMGDTDMVQTLLKYEADPDHGGGVYVPEEGRYVWITPLSAAVLCSNTDTVDVLIAAGATPDLALGDGMTPLIRASKLGDMKSVRILLTAGADPDLQDSLLGWTSLHYAAANGQGDVYKTLLSAGANPGLHDEQGRTAERLLKDGKNLP